MSDFKNRLAKRLEDPEFAKAWEESNERSFDMEFENTIDYLYTLDVEELTRLYVTTSHSDNFNKELIDLVKIEHEYLYGRSDIKYLDDTQIERLHQQIGEVILHSLSEDYQEKVELAYDDLSESITFTEATKNTAKNKHSELESIRLIHSNCYSVDINSEYVEYVYEDSNILAICLKSDYDYYGDGFPRWESVKPFDKDEITCIELHFSPSAKNTLKVPYKNVSTSGSYSENEKAGMYYNEDFVLIEWTK